MAPGRSRDMYRLASKMDCHWHRRVARTISRDAEAGLDDMIYKFGPVDITLARLVVLEGFVLKLMRSNCTHIKCKDVLIHLPFTPRSLILPDASASGRALA